MGYAHYFTQSVNCPAQKWDEITSAANKLIKALPFQVEVRSQEGMIIIDGHETFVLQRDKEDNGFSFCKTNRKPYDLVVCSILAIAEQFAPEVWRVESDGEKTEWDPAVKYAQEVLEREIKMPKAI